MELHISAQSGHTSTTKETFVGGGMIGSIKFKGAFPLPFGGLGGF